MITPPTTEPLRFACRSPVMLAEVTRFPSGAEGGGARLDRGRGGQGVRQRPRRLEVSPCRQLPAQRRPPTQLRAALR